MAVNFFATLTLTLILFATIQIEQNFAIKIEINPDNISRISKDDVHISCTPDDENFGAKEIVLMEILKDEGKPIVVMHRASKISVKNRTSTRLEVKGHIDNDVSQSYLNLTLEKPREHDGGMYICAMYILDEDALIQVDRANATLTNDKIDSNTVETFLLEKVNSLEYTIKKMAQRDNEITSVENSLVQKVNSLENTVNKMVERMNYTIAFSATTLTTFSASSNEILILPHVIMQVGSGYNRDNGIFTAPRDGLYAFQVVLSTNSDCLINMQLKVNNSVVARLYATSEDRYDQSSVSSVVSLKTGDRVFNYILNDGCQVYENYCTLFTGFLLKAY